MGFTIDVASGIFTVNCLGLFLSGSLLDVLKAQKERGTTGGMLSEVVVASVLHQTLRGLSYFHSQGQIHR